MTLTLRTVTSSQRLGLAPPTRLIKAQARSDIHAGLHVLQAAQCQATRLLDEAGAQAAALKATIEQQARSDATTARDAQAEAFLSATAACANHIQSEWEALRTAFEARAVRLVRCAVERLVDAVPPELSLHACVRELAGQAGEVDAGVLWVHPDDAARLAVRTVPLPWALNPDASLHPGELRLVSRQGRWHCSVPGMRAQVLSELG